MIDNSKITISEATDEQLIAELRDRGYNTDVIEIDEAYVRTNWDEALAAMDDRLDMLKLLVALDLKLREIDLYSLAGLHKEGKHRLKIEFLLNGCLRLDVYSDFKNERYDKYLADDDDNLIVGRAR